VKILQKVLGGATFLTHTVEQLQHKNTLNQRKLQSFKVTQWSTLLFEDRTLRSTTADTQDIATYTMAQKNMQNFKLEC